MSSRAKRSCARRRAPLDAKNDGATGLYYYRARYYSPALGRFISEDPSQFQGGANYYAYARDTPTGYRDPLGLYCVPGFDFSRLPRLLFHGTLDIAALLPYGIYYAAYNTQRYANESIDKLPPNLALPAEFAYAPVRAELWGLQAIGLAGDAGLDWVKGHTVNDETIWDEGKVGSINPLHQWMPPGTPDYQVYLPGLHADGTIDFSK